MDTSLNSNNTYNASGTYYGTANLLSNPNGGTNYNLIFTENTKKDYVLGETFYNTLKYDYIYDNLQPFVFKEYNNKITINNLSFEDLKNSYSSTDVLGYPSNGSNGGCNGGTGNLSSNICYILERVSSSHNSFFTFPNDNLYNKECVISNKGTSSKIYPSGIYYSWDDSCILGKQFSASVVDPNPNYNYSYPPNYNNQIMLIPYLTTSTQINIRQNVCVKLFSTSNIIDGINKIWDSISNNKISCLEIPKTITLHRDRTTLPVINTPPQLFVR